ncbi:MAG: magnesium/cobalt transporter CorA [Bacillota bacterium]
MNLSFNSIKKNNKVPPGTLKYTGNSKKNLNFDTFFYNEESIENKSFSNIPEIKETNKNIWIDIQGISEINSIKSLGKIYNIHILDLEDILNVNEKIKVSYDKDYIFCNLKIPIIKDDLLVFHHLSIILKDNILFTFNDEITDFFNPIKKRLLNNQGIARKENIDYLFYILLDFLTDHYFAILSKINKSFNLLEQKIINDQLKSTKNIYKIKKQLTLLNNTVLPTIHSVNSLFKGQNKKDLEFKDNHFFNDLITHLEQIQSDINVLLTMIDNLYEIEMTNKSDDMNEIMMTLTIFSTIFIPLSFLSGVFGMNFTDFPILNIENGFNIFLIICFIISIIMYRFFKNKDWF